MQYKKGSRVKHPKKPEWGVGQVLADSTADSVTIFFSRAGEKSIALDYVRPIKLDSREGSSLILDSLDFNEPLPTGKVVCKNCGGGTLFDVMAISKRNDLGWCSPCYQRSLNGDEVDQGEFRYSDSVRTIDGVRTPFSRK